MNLAVDKSFCPCVYARVYAGFNAFMLCVCVRVCVICARMLRNKDVLSPPVNVYAANLSYMGLRVNTFVCVCLYEGQAGRICSAADELGYLHMNHFAFLSEIK